MMTETRPAVLSRLFATPDYTESQAAEIIGAFRRVEFSRHSFFLRAGQAVRVYWYLESGFVRSYAVNPQGADTTTGFYLPEDIVIDWSAFFLRQPTRECFEALEAGVAWELDFENFQKFFHSIPVFRDAGRTRLVRSFFDLKRHDVALIADTAAERYQRLVTEQPLVAHKASLKHIASYLGITAPSLSRIRSRLARTAQPRPRK